MHYGWTSPSLPILTKGEYIISMSAEEGSWLVIALLLGTIAGAIATGQIANFIGRKTLIMWSALPLTAAWLLIAFGNTVEYLYAARVVAGLAVGMSLSVVPMYLGEISETGQRGTIASLCPVFIVAGLLLINILGSFLPINQAALVATCFPLALLSTFAWMPESPTFLLLKGKSEEAKESLVMLVGADEALREFQRLQGEIKKYNEEEKKRNFTSLFRDKANRKALIIAVGLRTVQQLCGTTVITFYCKTIFEESRDYLSPSISTILYFLLQLKVAIISSLIVDRTGRRTLLMISVSGTAITLLTTGFYLHLKHQSFYNTDHIGFIPIVSMFLYVVFFNIGLRTIPLVMLGEIFSFNVKSAAVSFTAIYFNLLSIAITKFFYFTLEYVGMHVAFYTFSFFCVAGLCFIYTVIPETKGKTLQEIQRHLAGEEITQSRKTEPVVHQSIKFIKECNLPHQ
ncbi:unnamed protein product [Brassicogethes aeneus]|uniref:Major facilitator superfamily (MFS) profile domain-containing protein n=1 Tax=Brassicogethes aeneus TaxID=1431903 RepID=A0A9P0AQD8_BRAAE|nr:unnamed protein product [Brassicogethes aeneus]